MLHCLLAGPGLRMLKGDPEIRARCRDVLPVLCFDGRGGVMVKAEAVAVGDESFACARSMLWNQNNKCNRCWCIL